MKLRPGARPTVAASAGRQVTIQVENDDDVKHNLSIPSVPIDIDFNPGEHHAVIFVAPSTAGALAFFCKFHRESGMQGTVRVRG